MWVPWYAPFVMLRLGAYNFSKVVGNFRENITDRYISGDIDLD